MAGDLQWLVPQDLDEMEIEIETRKGEKIIKKRDGLNRLAEIRPGMGSAMDLDVGLLLVGRTFPPGTTRYNCTTMKNGLVLPRGIRLR